MIQIAAVNARKKNNPLHGNVITLPFPENFIRNYYFFIFGTYLQEHDISNLLFNRNSLLSVLLHKDTNRKIRKPSSYTSVVPKMVPTAAQ